MEGETEARIIAAIFVGIVVTATAIELAHEDTPPEAEPASLIAPPVDPLRAAQRSCQRMGEAAASDPDCLAVWAETRDRFLGRNRSEDR